MKLIITSHGHTGEMALSDRGKVLDSVSFEAGRHLSEELGDKLDKIFRKNKIEVSQLKSLQVGVKADKGSMAEKVIQAFTKAIRFSL